MQIARFLSGGKICFGQVIDRRTARRIDIDEAASVDPADAAYPAGGLFAANGPKPFRVTDQRVTIDRWLSPLTPTDILCIGLNYREHAAESGSTIPLNPMLFIKAGNTLNHPYAPIPIPRRSSDIDYEGELAVIIGKPCQNVSKTNALEYVFGYTCGNDVSARDWQRDKSLGGGQFARGKSFDGFCPLGPWIVTADEIPNPNALHLRTLLNGQVMQGHTTADMIFDVPALIESLSSTMTLRPGDILMTGTPQGVGFARKPPVWMKAGDTVIVEIEKIGRLENPIAAAP